MLHCNYRNMGLLILVVIHGYYTEMIEYKHTDEKSLKKQIGEYKCDLLITTENITS